MSDTRQEAERARIIELGEDCAVEGLRRLESEYLARDLDVDTIDIMMAAARTGWARQIESALAALQARIDDVCTLTISGDTITVRRQLNAGELGPIMELWDVDALRARAMHVAVYLVGWSLKDEAGRPVVIGELPLETKMALLDSLDLDSYREIREAIERHSQAIKTERDNTKSEDRWL